MFSWLIGLRGTTTSPAAGGGAKGMAKGTLSPIGVDAGSAAVKLVQLCRTPDGRVSVYASAVVPAPAGVTRDAAALGRFFRTTVRAALDRHGFVGRRAVLAVPATQTLSTRARVHQDYGALPRDVQVAAAIADWLPFPAGQAIVRQVDAGEVYERGSVMGEVLLLGAPRRAVERYLDAASQARLQVRAVLPEPCALAAAPRSAPACHPAAAVMFVDLSPSSTRVYIARSGQPAFARTIDGPPPASADDAPGVGRLATEIDRCRHYFDSTFAAHSVGMTCFVGGRAGDRRLCSEIAARLNLKAAVFSLPARPCAAGAAGDAPPDATLAVAAGLAASGFAPVPRSAALASADA